MMKTTARSRRKNDSVRRGRSAAAIKKSAKGKTKEEPIMIQFPSYPRIFNFVI